MVVTLHQAVASARASHDGCFSFGEYEKYWIDFNPSRPPEREAALRGWAHPNSMNDNPTFYVGTLEEMVLQLFRLSDPVETIWGSF